MPPRTHPDPSMTASLPHGYVFPPPPALAAASGGGGMDPNHPNPGLNPASAVSAAASTAASKSKSKSGPQIFEKTVPLYANGDDQWLSPQLCLIRRHMEAFAATPHDAAERKSAGGSIVPPQVGQIGLRCVHCKHIPLRMRTKGSVLYPKSVRAIHMAMRNFQRHHMPTCPDLPPTVRDKFNSIKNKSIQSRKDSYIYLAKCCKNQGIVEVGGCLRFHDDFNLSAEALSAVLQRESDLAAGGGGAPRPTNPHRTWTHPHQEMEVRRLLQQQQQSNAPSPYAYGQQQAAAAMPLAVRIAMAAASMSSLQCQHYPQAKDRGGGEPTFGGAAAGMLMQRPRPSSKATAEIDIARAAAASSAAAERSALSQDQAVARAIALAKGGGAHAVAAAGGGDGRSADYLRYLAAMDQMQQGLPSQGGVLQQHVQSQLKVQAQTASTQGGALLAHLRAQREAGGVPQQQGQGGVGAGTARIRDWQAHAHAEAVLSAQAGAGAAMGGAPPQSHPQAQDHLARALQMGRLEEEQRRHILLLRHYQQQQEMLRRGQPL